MNNNGSQIFTPQNSCSNLYGLLIGEWAFEWYDRTVSSSRQLTGEWIFSRIPHSFGIMDNFICPSRQECERNGTTPRPRITQRYYNTQTGQWNTYDGDDDNLYRYLTKFTNDRIIITDQSNPDFMLQWIFDNIQLHSFHWLCQTSNDQGKTWHLIEEIFAKRRK